MTSSLFTLSITGRQRERERERGVKEMERKREGQRGGWSERGCEGYFLVFWCVEASLAGGWRLETVLQHCGLRLCCSQDQGPQPETREERGERRENERERERVIG